MSFLAGWAIDPQTLHQSGGIRFLYAKCRWMGKAKRAHPQSMVRMAAATQSSRVPGAMQRDISAFTRVFDALWLRRTGTHRRTDKLHGPRISSAPFFTIL